MTFGLPIATAIIGYVALALGGLAVVAYVLKMRRRRFEVPFSTLWQRVLREKEATSLWRRLKRLLSLLLALVMIGLLLFAALDPSLGEADDDAASVVILLDASASMKAEDEGEDGGARIDAAKSAVRDILGSLGGGDTAMVMKMDGQSTPLTRFESDMPRLMKLVEGVRASDTPADLRRALSAAADALRDRPNPLIVVVGDGAYDEETLGSVVWKHEDATAKLDAIDLQGIDVRYVPVGSTGENAGIIAFNARRYASDKTSYEIYIEVQNFGKETARRKLVLYNGDQAIDTRTLELKAGERLRQIYPSMGGGEDSVLRASLEIEAPADAEKREVKRDAFPLDDEAWALLPARRKQRILLVTQDNLYLEGAMLVYDNIEVDKLTPAEFDGLMKENALPEYAAVVLDEHAPALLPPPPTHLLYFHPTGPNAPFKSRGELSRPHVTEVNEDHPVGRWLVMSDVNFDTSLVFALDRDKGEVAIATSVRDPIIAAVRTKERKIVACGFPLAGTDMVMRTAFPLMLVNAFDWFASDEADLMTTYATGTRVRVPIDGVVGAEEAKVTSPTGRASRAPLVEGFAAFYAAEVGVHRLVVPGETEGAPPLAEVKLAANLSSVTESDIAPSSELILGGQKLSEPDAFHASHRQSLWLYLVLAAVLLLCVEWLTFNRRVTV
ncbi:MAG TPA: VWA domain-containing protein [Kofleriaceae bacterium]|nr:VWA domain-containing protein [Kofleriaceae bacterium]